MFFLFGVGKIGLSLVLCAGGECQINLQRDRRDLFTSIVFSVVSSLYCLRSTIFVKINGKWLAGLELVLELWEELESVSSGC